MGLKVKVVVRPTIAVIRMASPQARQVLSGEGQASCSISFIERQVKKQVAEIKLGDNETLESALRRFKRKVQQEDIIREVKRHAFYVPPGEKRRLKSALARKRNRKKYRRPIE